MSSLTMADVVARMRITVGIVTRNRNTHLKNCLKSLQKQIITPFEILIIDNASTDNTKKIVLQFKSKLPIRYIYEKKIGIPYARNRAIEQAKGDILAFIDDDVTVNASWTVEIIKAHTQYKKSIAIQGYAIGMPQNDIISQITQQYQNILLRTNTNLSIDQFCQAVSSGTQKGYLIKTVCTRNCSFKLKQLQNEGILFDSYFTRGSDTDLGKKLIQQKQEIIFYPTIVGHHWEKRSIREFLFKNFKRGQAQYKLTTRWHDQPKITMKNIQFNILFFINLFMKKETQKKIKFVQYSGLLYMNQIMIVSGYLYEKYKKIL